MTDVNKDASALTPFENQIKRLAGATSTLSTIMHRHHLTTLLSTDRYRDPKRLPAHGFKAYSQNEEDGIIQEIFRRIGTTNKRFVEMGCADGLENNTTYLLLSGWSGLWFDGNEAHIVDVEKRFQPFLSSGTLRARAARVDAENVNALLADVPDEIDLFSLDIDGNDFWVWQNIERLKPRVAVIEYNGTFRPPIAAVAPYDPKFQWDFTGYFGASLKALELLGRQKGYSLVGCNLTAANAFFVRDDLVGSHFREPFTAENHYESPAYGLYVHIRDIHRPGVGPYTLLGDSPAKLPSVGELQNV
jgi:hypothetical protein